MNTRCDENKHLKTPSASERNEFRPLKSISTVKIDQAIENFEFKPVKLHYKKKLNKNLPKHSRTILPSSDHKNINSMQKFNTFITFLISFAIVVGSSYEADAFFLTNHQQTNEINILRIFIAALAGLEVLLVVHYYKNVLRIKISYKILSKHSAVYQDKDILRKLILELIVCAIFIPPYVDYTFKVRQLSVAETLSISEIVLALVFLKTYYLFKFLYEISYFNTDKSRFYCDLFLIGSKFNFTMKAILKRRPFSSIFIVVLLTTLLFGMLVHLYEQSVEDSPLISTWNSLWLMAVTESTVGYGDLVPQTHLGRSTLVLTTLIGYFIYSYTTLIVKTTCEFTTKEYNLYSALKSKKITYKKLRHLAATLIQTWFRLLLKRKKKLSSIFILYNLNIQSRLFKYHRVKYIQESTQTLPLCIKRFETDVINKLRTLNKSYKSIENSEMQALKLANMNYAKLQKFKTYNRYMRKFLLSQASTYETDHLQIVTRKRRQSKTTDRISLQKLKGQAMKNMMKKRYSRSLVSHSQQSSNSESSVNSPSFLDE